MAKKRQSKSNIHVDQLSLFESFFYDETDVPALVQEESDESNKEEIINTFVAEEEPVIDRGNVSSSGRIDLSLMQDRSISLKEKIRRNINAIEILKRIEREDRNATGDEQDQLAEFSGWGGCPQVFDVANQEFIQQRNRLKELLSIEEYQNARASTLSSFYTPFTVIENIYRILNRCGFEKGKILEPSTGTGHFFGMMPEEIFSQSDIHGIEIDTITYSIAKYLYPSVTMNRCGFEESKYTDSSFDLIISNVPFGRFSVHDVELNRYHFHIHNYFFAKALSKVRNGGLIAFITSKETLDGNSAIKDYLSSRANLIGAIRLPNNTFRMNGANTDVVSDIIFLQRNDSKIIDWENEILLMPNEKATEHCSMNRYFIDHPEMVFGTVKEIKNQWGNFELTVEPDGKTIEEHFEEIAGSFYEIYEENLEEANTGSIYHTIEPQHAQIADRSFFIENDILYFRQDNVYYEVKTQEQMSQASEELLSDHVVMKSQEDITKAKLLVGIAEQAVKVIDAQNQQLDEEIYLERRKELNDLYDSFVQKYGAINKITNSKLLGDDSRNSLLHSLEEYNSQTKEIRKNSIFYERTIKPKKEVKHVENLQEGIRVCLDVKGKLDISFISAIYDKNENEIYDELLSDEYAYLDAETEQPVLADEYLSGNVRRKLAAAKQRGLAVNVSALEKVMPEDIRAEDIKAQLGAVWIPEKYYKQFIGELFDLSDWDMKYFEIRYDDSLGMYLFSRQNEYSNTIEKIWGVAETDADWHIRQPRYNGYDLLDDVINSKVPTIYDYWTEYDVGGEKTKRKLNPERTNQARELAERMNERFEEWIFDDFDRRNELEKIYNERFNSVRLRTYDGSYLTFPGMSPAFQLEPYQKDAVARIISGNNTLLWQQVGAGKTMEMIAGGMELKRMGLRHKLLYVVPKHLISQWENEFRKLYPNANLLVATSNDFQKKDGKRQTFVNKIATGNYDAIIMSHSSFKLIQVSSERQNEFLNQDIAQLNAAIEEARNLDNWELRNRSTKALERTKKSIENNIKKMTDFKRDDNLIPFDQLGIDLIVVDECQAFKNLYNYTAMNNVAGLPNAKSERASDMYMKCKIIQENGGQVVFATGTPITNTMAELYTLQRYLQEDALHEQGIYCFDAWAKNYGKVVNSFEISIDGTRFQNRTRFCKFFNVAELMNTFREVAEIQSAGMLRKALSESVLGRKMAVPPKHIGGKPVIVALEPSEELKQYIDTIVERSEAIHNRQVSPSQDNMLKITSDSKKASIDLRLISDDFDFDPNGKLSVVAQNIAKIYHEYDDDHATQLVFCDASTPASKHIPLKPDKDGVLVEDPDGFYNVYHEIRKLLVRHGIPQEEIAFIHDHGTETKKLQLFKKMNEGKVRVLFGSTSTLGAGTNVQQRLIAIHHVDVPWLSSDIEQQNGRGFRQGNMYSEIYEFRYVTKQSFDAYSWQIVETKASYMTQLQESSDSMREYEEDIQASFSYAEVKAIASGNPLIKEKFEIDAEIKRLEGLKKQYLKKRIEAQNDIVLLPKLIRKHELQFGALQQEYSHYADTIYPVKEITEKFSFTDNEGKKYPDMKSAGEYLNGIKEKLLKDRHSTVNDVRAGLFLNSDLYLGWSTLHDALYIKIKTPMRLLEIDEYHPVGRINFERIVRKINDLHIELEKLGKKISLCKNNQQVAENILNMKFEHEEEYHQKRMRQKEIEHLLGTSKDERIDENSEYTEKSECDEQEL